MIYIVIWKDRHTDIGVYPFSTKELAIDWAQKQVDTMVAAYGPPDEEEELNETMIEAGWVFFYCYTCEGDYISVRECELDVGDGHD